RRRSAPPTGGPAWPTGARTMPSSGRRTPQESGEAEAVAEAGDEQLEGAEDEKEEEEHDEDGEAGDDGEDGEGGAEGEVAQGLDDEMAAKNLTYNAKDVNDQVFEELHLGAMAAEVQGAWNEFLRSAESREAAGEAIYAAVFDAAPSLQALFKTPRAVMAMRFMNGLNQIIASLADPKGLKVVVETLAFQHLDLEVTIPRTVIFRDAIVDLLAVELGARLAKKAREGWYIMLNYVGGAYIYTRLKFADRLKVLASSWATANNKKEDEFAEAMAPAEDEEKEGEEKGENEGDDVKKAVDDQQEIMMGAKKDAPSVKKKKQKSRGWGFGSAKDADKQGPGHEMIKNSEEADGSSFRNTSVPTTYTEMFFFNAAVMGFGQSTWMNEVLASFDTIVTNVANSYRLQEECDVLSLRIAKYRGQINLGEYKAVMLASLRSLVPKDWNSQHEVAWTWLWENVERMLKAHMGKPAAQERALDKLWANLDETSQAMVRREVYSKFFMLAPAGQDFFKQSTTRLHFIADRIVSMTLEIFKDPKKMVEDISALGLRHVGYGIPTDLFGPFVTACVQVVRSLTDDDVAEEAFRWSLSLISRILTRVITEGSTIVMKAINTNSGKALKKAVACAPRGKRALWMLNIQVGTQSISPFMWAIETGSLEAAKAIIVDLLTIRADRDRYYYGMDTLFERHPDVVKRLCVDAPALLVTLFDGLVWRSRTTENGQRRVNYYVKHLLTDSDGTFSKAIEWVTDNGDPKIVCHPVISMVTDVVWSRIAFRTFLMGKMWLLVTLVVFICGTSAMKHTKNGVDNEPIRYTITACRCFIYMFSLGQWMYYHAKHTLKDIRSRNFVHFGIIPLPEYLTGFQDACSCMLTLCLVSMIAMEPILHCFPHRDEDFENNGLFTEVCPQAKGLRKSYSVVAALATIMYFSLTIDLSVFSTRVSAFVLVIFRVLAEVALFLFGLVAVMLSFSCAVSALDHNHKDFEGILASALSMIEITFHMYDTSQYANMVNEQAVLVAVILYIITTVVFFSNLLIAQLNCAYQSTYQDMVGYARLNRGKVVTEAMSFASDLRWQKFLASLRLDERCEFGEGDIGLAGGIQALQGKVDMIRRFGGSTSPLAQWPEDDALGEDEDDRMERLEKLIDKAVKRMAGSRGGRRQAGTSSGQGGSSMGQTVSSESDHEPSDDHE
ncbi:unnamed protein product, partial [Prorocentrum cordatum]